MRRTLWLGLALSFALVGGQGAFAADYWDLAGETDGLPGTDNELIHGSSQQHDLEALGGVADEDWSVLVSYPRASYEALVEATSGDLNMFNLGNFTRLDYTGGTVLQTSEYANPGSNTGYSTALRWFNGTTGISREVLRVVGGCGTGCNTSAQYRLRFYETTVSVPRFNNAGGQTTVLLVQNSTGWSRPITGIIYLWNAAGTLLGSFPFSVDPRAALILNTATVAGGAGVAGTISVVHDGGYGGLAIKSVALEPATGFSFDTPGTYKPN